MYQEIFNEALQQLKYIAEGINNPWTIWVSLLGVFVALLLGVLGIFQDWIRSWFRNPRIKVSIKVAPPDCHKTSFYRSDVDRKVCDTYYFRFRVENTGNFYAEDVEAMITEVYKKDGGQYKKVMEFLPLNLVWSHYRQITIPKIQPKLFKHLDLGYILKPETEYLTRFNIRERPNVIFELDVAVRPNTGSHILIPGDYKIKIIFAANNHKPVEKIYSLTIKDAWSDDEGEMLNDNVSIKEENYV